MNSSPKQCMFHVVLIHFLLLLNNYKAAHIVKYLPGYPGTLPFKLETGYIGVGETDEVQLLYYFIESERDPSTDPLIFWLTGGPGCSGLSAIVFEIGPFAFSVPTSDERFPSLVLNPYSWTKVANVIFIDSPAGTGFSYSTTSQGYSCSDTKTTNDNYTFLRKVTWDLDRMSSPEWLLNHPTFIKNHMYIGGDSYAGTFVPLLAMSIDKGNGDGLHPRMDIQGYITGNGRSDFRYVNERIPYAHRMALISDEYYELAKSSCYGEYVNPDPSNYKCLHALRLIKECMSGINLEHILEPRCLSLVEETRVSPFLLLKEEGTRCRHAAYKSAYVWADDGIVQEALHIRKGTVTEWVRCNRSLHYDKDVPSVYEYHQALINKGYRILAYSGDHDMVVPYTSTLKWIRHLNLTIHEAWRPWIVGGQVAGYTETYKNNVTYLTFATVKGAGHTAPEYKPKECLAMFSRWLSLYHGWSLYLLYLMYMNVRFRHCPQ